MVSLNRSLRAGKASRIRQHQPGRSGVRTTLHRAPSCMVTEACGRELSSRQCLSFTENVHVTTPRRVLRAIPKASSGRKGSLLHCKASSRSTAIARVLLRRWHGVLAELHQKQSQDGSSQMLLAGPGVFCLLGMYIHPSMHACTSISISLYIYIYIVLYVCVYVCVYIYIYIYIYIYMYVSI